MRRFNLETQDWEGEEEKSPSALRLLQAIYMDEGQPLHTRMKAARECLPFESPKLGIMGYAHEAGSFAQALERAIQRSREGRVTLELSANPDAGQGEGAGKVRTNGETGGAGKVPSAWRPGR
jgi:hypothetical protein